jgi:hypothetical protein
LELFCFFGNVGQTLDELLFREKVEKAFVEHSDISEVTAHFGADGFDFIADLRDGFLSSVIFHISDNDYSFVFINTYFHFIERFFAWCGTMRAAWNISVEHFFLRGTIPWNIFSAWNILGKLLATRFSVVANGLRLPGPARLSQVTCN